MVQITNWLMSRQVANLLGIKRQSVSRLAKRGELTRIHLSNNYILIADDEKLAAAKIKAAAGGFQHGGPRRREKSND